MQPQYDDDYRALIEDARDAVRRLLDESEHDSWPSCRTVYGLLRDALIDDDQRRDQATALIEARSHDEEWTRSREIEADWKRTPMERREALLLQALGEDRLTKRELTARLNRALGGSVDCGSRVIYESNVDYLLKTMLSSGQLDRRAEAFKGKSRWRYFRKPGLDGPIADLERAYGESGE